MGKKYLIGVDLGTSSTKAALYQIDGALVSEATIEVQIYYPRPGVVEQENEDFYTSGAVTTRRCIETSGIDPKDIAAIAFDSQMAGIGMIDEDYRPAGRFDSWLDMRCQPYIAWMEDLFILPMKITQFTSLSWRDIFSWKKLLTDYLHRDCVRDHARAIDWD